MSESTSSTARTPSTVLSSTGHTAPKTMTMILAVSPMPANRNRIGISAGGGMARKNSSTGSVSRRSVRLAPSSTPSPIPSTTAPT